MKDKSEVKKETPPVEKATSSKPKKEVSEVPSPPAKTEQHREKKKKKTFKMIEALVLPPQMTNIMSTIQKPMMAMTDLMNVDSKADEEDYASRSLQHSLAL